jgi:hypothetical protein
METSHSLCVPELSFIEREGAGLKSGVTGPVVKKVFLTTKGTKKHENFRTTIPKLLVFCERFFMDDGQGQEWTRWTEWTRMDC